VLLLWMVPATVAVTALAHAGSPWWVVTICAGNIKSEAGHAGAWIAAAAASGVAAWRAWVSCGSCWPCPAGLKVLLSCAGASACSCPQLACADQHGDRC
jgi:hypothetical protein